MHSTQVRGRPNHTLQRTGGQRCFSARWSGRRSVAALPPPLSVGRQALDRDEDTLAVHRGLAIQVRASWP